MLKLLLSALLLTPGVLGGGALLVHTSPPVTGHQGYATDGVHHYLFDTQAIRVYDAQWRLVRENLTATQGADRNHLGDGHFHEGRLYVPVENWFHCAWVDSPAVAVYDAETLTLLAVHPLRWAFEAAALVVVPATDRFGLGGREGRVYVVDYCGDNRILAYDLPDFAPAPPIVMAAPLAWMQGLAYRDGHFYIHGSDGTVHTVDATATPAVPLKQFQDPHAGVGEGLDFTQVELRLHRDQGGPGGARVYSYQMAPLSSLEVQPPPWFPKGPDGLL